MRDVKIEKLVGVLLNVAVAHIRNTNAGTEAPDIRFTTHYHAPGKLDVAADSGASDKSNTLLLYQRKYFGAKANERPSYLEISRDLVQFAALPPMILHQVAYNEPVAPTTPGGRWQVKVRCPQYFIYEETAQACFDKRGAARNPIEAIHLPGEFFVSELQSQMSAIMQTATANKVLRGEMASAE